MTLRHPVTHFQTLQHMSNKGESSPQSKVTIANSSRITQILKIFEQIELPAQFPDYFFGVVQATSIKVNLLCAEKKKESSTQIPWPPFPIQGGKDP